MESGIPPDPLTAIAHEAGLAQRVAAELITHLLQTEDITAARKARILREAFGRIVRLATDDTVPL